MSCKLTFAGPRGGPIRLAASLLNQETGDCLAADMRSPEMLLHPEPDFYILGSKSYGRLSHFLLRTGLTQIRNLFTIIEGSSDLNLYETVDNRINPGKPASP